MHERADHQDRRHDDSRPPGVPLQRQTEHQQHGHRRTEHGERTDPDVGVTEPGPQPEAHVVGPHPGLPPVDHRPHVVERQRHDASRRRLVTPHPEVAGEPEAAQHRREHDEKTADRRIDPAISRRPGRAALAVARLRDVHVEAMEHAAQKCRAPSSCSAPLQEQRRAGRRGQVPAVSSAEAIAARATCIAWTARGKPA